MFSQCLSKWFSRLSSVAVGFAIALLYACASSGPGGGAVSVAIPGGSADQFLIVDCLLPPQIRKLGTRMTCLAARRAIRTSAGDSETRGGEYAAYDRASDRGHWLPVDAEPESRANWISNIQITDILNSMNARHIMVIADSCYSGTLARAATTSIEGGRGTEQKIKWFEAMIKTPSRTVLTAGGVKPVLDSGGGHSIFANGLLQLLRAKREVLEGPLLYRQIAKEVKTAAARLSVEQDPPYAPMKFAGNLDAPFFFVPKGQGLALRSEVFDDLGAEQIAAAGAASLNAGWQ